MPLSITDVPSAQAMSTNESYSYVNYLDFVHLTTRISERTLGKFLIFALINSAFGYEFRAKMGMVQI